MYTNKHVRGGRRVAATSYMWVYRPSYAHVITGAEKIRYATIAEKTARKYDLDPELVKAVIAVESGFDPKAISPKGALGLMQLMPGTAARFDVDDPFQPEQNIEGGVKYLRFLFDMFEGNVIYVLASYNAGENAVTRAKGIPPYRETENYVRKVLALRNHVKPEIGPFLTRKRLWSYIDTAGLTHITDKKPSRGPGVAQIRRIR